MGSNVFKRTYVCTWSVEVIEIAQIRHYQEPLKFEYIQLKPKSRVKTESFYSRLKLRFNNYMIAFFKICNPHEIRDEDPDLAEMADCFNVHFNKVISID